MSPSLPKIGIEPQSTSLSIMLAYLHAVFSYQYLLLKSIVIILVGSYNLGRHEERKFEMWLRSDRKRFELYWKNSGESNKTEHFYTILGGAVILVIVSYIAVSNLFYPISVCLRRFSEYLACSALTWVTSTKRSIASVQILLFLASQ